MVAQAWPSSDPSYLLFPLNPLLINFTHQTALNMSLFQTIITPTVTYEQPLGLYMP
jgi:hypothetical protein